METIGTIWLWGGFTAFVLAMLALDLGVFHRKAHEVRFREESGHGLPEESVGPAKRRRIAAAARAYLATIPRDSWNEARFDVAAVDGGGSDPSIRYYPGAFDAKGKIL